MSDVKVVRALLVDETSVTAIVPAERIVAGVLPESIALPAISVTHVSGQPMNMVTAGAKQFRTARAQVTVVAKSYPSLEQIMAAVRSALREFRGTAGDTEVDSVLLDAEGPDLVGSDQHIVMRSQDVIVKFNE